MVWRWARISVQACAWGPKPELCSRDAQTPVAHLLRDCCGSVRAAGWLLELTMSLGQSPQPLLWWLPRFFSQSNCMTVWRGKRGTTFDLQESRGIVVKLPIDFPAFQSRKAFFSTVFDINNSCREGMKGRRLRIEKEFYLCKGVWLCSKYLWITVIFWLTNLILLSCLIKIQETNQ